MGMMTPLKIRSQGAQRHRRRYPTTYRLEPLNKAALNTTRSEWADTVACCFRRYVTFDAYDRA